MERKGYLKDYEIRNKEKIKKRKHTYYLKNKEKIRRRNHNWYMKNKEKKRLKHNEWAKKNPEKMKTYWTKNNKNRMKNPDVILDNKRRCRERYNKLKNSPEFKLKEKKRRDKNKARRKEYDKGYRKSEKGKAIKKRDNLRRRVLKNNCKNTLTKEELKIIKNRDENCVYCGKRKKLTLEHIIPLNKGGENSFNNSVMACLSCNSSKKDKNVFEWCNEQNIEVPKIILSLLNEQNKILIDCKGVEENGTSKRTDKGTPKQLNPIEIC